MNPPTTGTQIAEDRVDRYRSFGAFGKPAWQSHIQLRAMIRQRLGERCANYFAVPTYDPDAGVIRWTVPVGGKVRSWHELSAEDQAMHALDMEEVRGELINFATELRSKGDGQPGGAAAFASLLEQAMKVPADGHFLFMAGNQPVIAFWGFENPAGGAVDPLDPAATPALTPPPAPSAALAPTTVEPVIVPAPVRRKRAWWWWLLALLLLLLLLLALLRSCGADGSIDLRRAVPGLAPPEGAASAPGGNPGALPIPGARGDVPALPGVGAPGAIDPVLPGASAPGTVPPPEGAASVPGTIDAIDPTKSPDPKADPKADPKVDPKADP